MPLVNEKASPIILCYAGELKLFGYPNHQRLSFEVHFPMLPVENIPSSEDWGPIQDGDSWTRKIYIGKSLNEVIYRFSELPTSVAEDLSFMADGPFRYYIFGFQKILFPSDGDEKMQAEDPGLAANAFLNVVHSTLKQCPHKIMPVMEQLLPTVEYVAGNQATYEAAEEVFGNFQEILTQIQFLYSIRQCEIS